ncbi:MAG: VWA domain-containing protein [Bacteroidia bacterium]|nr:VWA domain-containing protein [Bacteroidia bacterium]
MQEYFANPEAAWLALVPAIFLLWYFIWYSPRRVVVPLSYDPSDLQKQGLNWSWLRFIPILLLNAGLLLCVYALMRPQTSLETTQRYSEGIDIMLLLDTSGSMETEDFSPNRLEVAKDNAIKFIEGRVDDRIGLVVFAEDAFSYAPLTLDYELLKKQISAIKSKMMPNKGTAIGSAIAIGINRMMDSDSKSRVMILMTDGASNRGQLEPALAARLARKRGIKIYSIGIGKKTFTQQTAFGPQTVKSDLDEEALQEIADITGGLFFRSTDESGLETIFSKISQMEKTEILEETSKDVTDKYPQFLLWGIILLVAGFLLMGTFLFNPLEG